MPRPVFGQADWWTFDELDAPERFPANSVAQTDFEGFRTRVASEAAGFVWEHFPDDDDELLIHYPRCPHLEFLVSRGNKRLLKVRRKE